MAALVAATVAKMDLEVKVAHGDKAVMAEAQTMATTQSELNSVNDDQENEELFYLQYFV